MPSETAGLLLEGDGGVAKDAILRRRSVRRFADRPVPRELVLVLLDAACQAPSPHNRQPWRFAVLSEAPAKAVLADAMAARLRADREGDGDAPASIEADVARSRVRLTMAPVLVVVCLTMEEMDIYPDAARQNAERTMAVQAAAAATQTLMLAAAGRGLGSCWMCAPLFCAATVVNVLSLPNRWEPQALVTLGYPDGTPARLRGRNPLNDVVHWLNEDETA